MRHVLAALVLAVVLLGPSVAAADAYCGFPPFPPLPPPGCAVMEPICVCDQDQTYHPNCRWIFVCTPERGVDDFEED